jgi:hypothetical protein
MGCEILSNIELERMIKRVERINRILTVAVLAEVVVLVLFI